MFSRVSTIVAGAIRSVQGRYFETMLSIGVIEIKVFSALDSVAEYFENMHSSDEGNQE